MRFFRVYNESRRVQHQISWTKNNLDPISEIADLIRQATRKILTGDRQKLLRVAFFVCVGLICHFSHKMYKGYKKKVFLFTVFVIWNWDKNGNAAVQLSTVVTVCLCREINCSKVLQKQICLFFRCRTRVCNTES